MTKLFPIMQLVMRKQIPIVGILLAIMSVGRSTG